MNLKTRMQSCPRGHLPNSWNLGSSASHAQSLLCHAAPQRDFHALPAPPCATEVIAATGGFDQISGSKESRVSKGGKKSKEMALIFFGLMYMNPNCFCCSYHTGDFVAARGCKSSRTSGVYGGTCRSSTWSMIEYLGVGRAMKSVRRC